MNSSGRVLLLAASFAVFGAIHAGAQVISSPTPAPIVTAGSEPWYLNGDPITFSGNFYYPAGAQVPFSPNEMVRSGFFAGVPLYTRTFDEPYSTVYIPVGRGFMQPYMRPRTGDVAGSAGTTSMAGTAARVPTADATTVPLMQSGPPTLIAGPPADELGRPGGVIPSTAPRDNTRPVGTSGTVIEEPLPVGTSGRVIAPTPMRTRIGPRPSGLNAVFVEYKGRRWYADGRAVAVDPARMLEIGVHHGFTVYADREKPEARLYIATVIGGATATPYVRR
jgi:hypothetical protein